jgi:hypothetical protein
MFSHTPDSSNPAALLASEGDLISFGDEFFVYRKASGNKFHLTISYDGGYVNGKISTLNLRKREHAIPWFKQMKTSDLSALEFIKIDTMISEDYYPYLAELAKIKPGLGLYYDSDIKDISDLIKLFNPRYLVGGIIYGSDFDLLSSLTNLEILVALLDDSAKIEPLPAMPKLKHLLLSSANDKLNLDDKFLSENRTLESITIMDSKRINCSILNPLDNLKELIISNFDTIENIDLIKNHTNLEVLSIINEKLNFRSVADELTGIRWITFSPDVTQGDFDSFISRHPDLEVAEILNNDTIISFSPLLKLNNLYGLTVTDTLRDLASVKALKNLKYLSLPSEVLDDKLVREELEKLLPDTRIVANEGFCLGSGWLLLLVPLVLFFRFFSERKLHKADNSV